MSQRRLLTRPSDGPVDLSFITEAYLRDEIERAFQIHEEITRLFRQPMPGNPQRVLSQVGRQETAVLLRQLYQEAMPDAVDHLELAAFINERAGQVVPLFHIQLKELHVSYVQWTLIYDLMIAVSQAMNQAKQSRPVSSNQTFYSGWSEGVVPTTLGTSGQIAELLRENRHLIEYNPSPRQWFEMTEMASSLGQAQLAQFKINNAVNNFGIPLFMAEVLTTRGLFNIYRGIDYSLYNRRMGFARIAAIIMDFILE